MLGGILCSEIVFLAENRKNLIFLNKNVKRFQFEVDHVANIFMIYVDGNSMIFYLT